MGKTSRKRRKISLTPLDDSAAISVNPPGIRSVFLQADYGSLPDSSLQNGHIFFLLLSSKPLEVARLLQEKGLYGNCSTDQLRGKVQLLEGKGLKASKKLSDHRAMERYKALCCEQFSCDVVPRNCVQSDRVLPMHEIQQHLTPGKTVSPLKTPHATTDFHSSRIRLAILKVINFLIVHVNPFLQEHKEPHHGLP